MNKLIENRYRQRSLTATAKQPASVEEVLRCHRVVPRYSPTPTTALPSLASRLGVGRIFIKDESPRFGLNAFKALGASYTIYRWINAQRAWSGQPALTPEALYRSKVLARHAYTFCTATDGNHGRGVAWVARLLDQRAVIYMPQGTVAARIENIRREGATVVVVDGTYDLAVARAKEDATVNGWIMVSDTSWPGYHQIPLWISEGYLTLFAEIDEHLGGTIPDVVFVPGGVGALAATAAWWYSRTERLHRARLVSVEPTTADCLYRSIESADGLPVTTDAPLDSIMAGLNCGTPSEVAWPYIRDRFDIFMTIDDRWAIEAMRRYYYPYKGDSRITSGESGAAALGALLAICNDDVLIPQREKLGLTEDATVLLLNTEGATDPEHFAEVVRSRPSG